MKKSIGVTITALFFIILFFAMLVLSVIYGGIVIFAQGNPGASFWLKAIVAVFQFLFPKMKLFILIAILFSAMGLFVSVALMRRIQWSRFLFVTISILLFCWYIYRLYVIYTNEPMFVSVKAIFGSNPATRIISLIYYAGSIVIIAFEVILAFVIKSLTSKKAALDFSAKSE